MVAGAIVLDEMLAGVFGGGVAADAIEAIEATNRAKAKRRNRIT
jgi:hypothetical protein